MSHAVLELSFSLSPSLDTALPIRDVLQRPSDLSCKLTLDLSHPLSLSFLHCCIYLSIRLFRQALLHLYYYYTHPICSSYLLCLFCLSLLLHCLSLSVITIQKSTVHPWSILRSQLQL
ncbi:hypothetical protein CC2G_014355 [Coprinopsis cinerea AmutBmut pab1-1]|nr:hypothetical protein CC2G_014355 [Coprinopsis cinerea AmutBmut pab1-1]